MRCGTSFYNGTLGRQLTLRFWPLIALYTVIWAMFLPFVAITTPSPLPDTWESPEYILYNVKYVFQWVPLFLAVGFGVLVAMAVCSHLYSTRSANFTAALSPKRTAMFATHYLTGLLWLVVPFLVMAAIAMVEGLVEDDVIRYVAKTFGGVEHRIELVRVKDGVKFYNDSIASSPSRTIAGLRSFREKVILIAGGYDKHIPYDVLGPEICAHVKKLFLGGATGPKIRQAVESCSDYNPAELEIVDCGTFAPAVKAAAASAEPGDVVLMSPASAAFDQFKNFMVRGNYFKELVKEL